MGFLQSRHPTRHENASSIARKLVRPTSELPVKGVSVTVNDRGGSCAA
jgi:hypothetical protein